ncbi:MAG: helix-hairpin-helix domain-containing protein [Candidatus Omnitrophica bacterium]|nr:helix-hairpin-helix domain-containing protein [Candidatus Omnitrophota bacterium]
MAGLSREERWAVVFLGIMIFAGTGVLYARAQGARHEVTVVQGRSTVKISLKEIEEQLAEERKININMAEPEDIEKIPGIGKVMAGRIADYVRTNGPFASYEDVLKVRGIGPAKLEKIKFMIKL